MANSYIALMTDFGARDPFVGIMKGVIFSINPEACVFDLCHDLTPGDIQEAAFALTMAFPYLPQGCIAVCVVDPGVGTERAAVAVDLDNRVYLGPDNGILTWVLRKHSPRQAVKIVNTDYFLEDVSSTFHGRDVFAPASAHLSKGIPLDALGPNVENLVTFPVPEVIISSESLKGEVVYIDRFGNLVTNISKKNFESWAGTNVRIRIGSAEIIGIQKTYGDTTPGHTVALFGSFGMLEIAVNGGSAAESLSLSRGAKVLIFQS